MGLFLNKDYFSRVNYDLFSVIPGGLSCVLEVGCGSGEMGLLYKTKYPKSRYFGIELDSNAAIQAELKIDSVLNVDVEDFGQYWNDFPLVDCLVYGDVLEHLHDPWNVLRRHSLRLKQSGVVVACIPNVQHWSVLATLMRGDWPVMDEGLFDRTHLRWFTKRGICELFHQSGLAITAMHARVIAPEKCTEFSEAMKYSLEILGINMEEFAGGTFPFQYIVVARK